MKVPKEPTPMPTPDSTPMTTPIPEPSFELTPTPDTTIKKEEQTHTPESTPVPEKTLTHKPTESSTPKPDTTPSATITPSPSSSSSDRIVYWTPTGKSYHYTKACQTLKRSKTIYEGPLSECPNSNPCDKCVK